MSRSHEFRGSIVNQTHRLGGHYSGTVKKYLPVFRHNHSYGVTSAATIMGRPAAKPHCSTTLPSVSTEFTTSPPPPVATSRPGCGGPYPRDVRPRPSAGAAPHRVGGKPPCVHPACPAPSAVCRGMRPRAGGVGPTDGKVDRDDQFAIADHHDEQDAINAGEHPVFLAAPPGAHQAPVDLWRSQSLHTHVTHAPSPLCTWCHHYVTCSQNFLLSFVTHLGYNCARVALPFPTPSSARRIGLERVGHDF
jgi:hypothetical protein